MAHDIDRPRIVKITLGPISIGGRNEIEVNLAGGLSYRLYGSPEEAEAIAANAGLQPFPGAPGVWK